MGKNKNKKIAHLDKFKELVVYEKTLDFSNSGWKSKIDVYYTFNNVEYKLIYKNVILEDMS